MGYFVVGFLGTAFVMLIALTGVTLNRGLADVLAAPDLGHRVLLALGVVATVSTFGGLIAAWCKNLDFLNYLDLP